MWIRARIYVFLHAWCMYTIVVIAVMVMIQTQDVWICESARMMRLFALHPPVNTPLCTTSQHDRIDCPWIIYLGRKRPIAQDTNSVNVGTFPAAVSRPCYVARQSVMVIIVCN